MIASISYVSISGDARVDVLMSGVKWSSNALTFSLRVSAPEDEYGAGFAELNDMQKTAVQQALAKWAAACNLTITEVPDTGSGGVLRFGTCSSEVVNTSCAYYPGDGEDGGDVWFGNSNSSAPDNPVAGNYDYHAIMHEIGHALGLKHPHSDSWYGSFPIADVSVDAMQNTVMSYSSYVGSTDGGYVNDSDSFTYGPMAYDIAATQYLYGANFDHNSGDTVYFFDPDQAKIFETIWDGGGVDSYNLSAYSTGVSVTLEPGQWSTFSPAQRAWLNWADEQNLAPGSVCNAFLYNDDPRSLIENAVGGSGNDSITGNAANNQLEGGAGNDTLVGGGGIDYLYGGIGNDLLIAGCAGGSYSMSQYSFTGSSAGYANAFAVSRSDNTAADWGEGNEMNMLALLSGMNLSDMNGISL